VFPRGALELRLFQPKAAECKTADSVGHPLLMIIIDQKTWSVKY
jgi:hypothetical protein